MRNTVFAGALASFVAVLLVISSVPSIAASGPVTDPSMDRSKSSTSVEDQNNAENQSGLNQRNQNDAGFGTEAKSGASQSNPDTTKKRDGMTGSTPNDVKTGGNDQTRDQSANRPEVQSSGTGQTSMPEHGSAGSMQGSASMHDRGNAGSAQGSNFTNDRGMKRSDSTHDRGNTGSMKGSPSATDRGMMQRSTSDRGAHDTDRTARSEGGEAIVARVDSPDNCLRIRSEPSSSGNQIGCMNKGETLHLTGVFSSDGRWAQLDNNGWVFFDQVRTDVRPPESVRGSWKGSAGAAGSGSSGRSSKHYRGGGSCGYGGGYYGYYNPGYYYYSYPGYYGGYYPGFYY